MSLGDQVEEFLDEADQKRLLEAAAKSLASIDQRLASQNRILSSIEDCLIAMTEDHKQPND